MFCYPNVELLQVAWARIYYKMNTVLSFILGDFNSPNTLFLLNMLLQWLTLLALTPVPTQLQIPTLPACEEFPTDHLVKTANGERVHQKVIGLNFKLATA